MRRSNAFVYAAAVLLSAAPAAADCLVAPGLPGGGVTMSCDGSPPNPLHAILSGSPNDDEIGMDDGFALDTAPGFPSVDVGEGDDLVSVGEGVVLAGPIEGGPGDDELSFTQTLAPADCAAAIAAVEAADPAAGSITIEGLVYEWSGFETLTPAFDCLPITDVPALSWRGLLALGLLLAALGVGVLRARP
ncbi:MAG TPA: hypothetical protein VF100_10960 [Thermoanaerobaculia bacterium]